MKRNEASPQQDYGVSHTARFARTSRYAPRGGVFTPTSNKLLAITLAILLLLYPLYSVAQEQADTSPNMPLLGDSGTHLGDSGSSLGTSSVDEDDFYDRYLVEAPDRKIPLNMNFDLLYGVFVTDKNGSLVKSQPKIVDADGFDVSVQGSYEIVYTVTVNHSTATFGRTITVTTYTVDMNNLLIIKESESTPPLEPELSEKELALEQEREATSFGNSLFVADTKAEDSAVPTENGLAEQVYYVAPADASSIEPSKLEELEKSHENDSPRLGSSSPNNSEELDILSTNPNGANLEPLDLRYGITVLNSANENIAQYLEVADDDGFSMEQEAEQEFDVDYAIVHNGAVAVQLHRSVNVLDATGRAVPPTSSMKIQQTVTNRQGVISTIDVTWGTDGDIRINVDDARQYSGVGSGTVLRFLNGPLTVEQDVKGKPPIVHDVVGDNIHSFLGRYVQTTFTKPYDPDIGVTSFPTVSGGSVNRKAFAGADTQSIRSPLLNNTEADLRNKVIDNTLLSEYSVFEEKQIDTLTMKRVYTYYPSSGLLSKEGATMVANNKPLFKLEVFVRLVPGELKLLREITITNLAYDYKDGTGNTPVFEGHLLYLADTMFEGTDYGFGFRDDIDDTVFVRGVNDGSRTMMLQGSQRSEAHFAGAWYWSAGGYMPPNYIPRYSAVYGPNWESEALHVYGGGTPETGMFPYKNNAAGTITAYLMHTSNPFYQMNARTPLEGELPKNLETVAYPVAKSVFATDIPGDGNEGSSKTNFKNGSYDTSYAMQWALPKTPVGESYTFVIQEDWLDSADIQIIGPPDKTVESGKSTTLRFSAENTHMFDYALPETGQDWDINATFTVESNGSAPASDWTAKIIKVQKLVNGALVDVTPQAGQPFQFLVKPGERYYFDVSVDVDSYALGDETNAIVLKAVGTNKLGHPVSSSDTTIVTADSLATITAVTAQNISSATVNATVTFHNAALINPEDPLVKYNTTVKLYDSSGTFVSEASDKISSGGFVSFTGLTLTPDATYRLVATAVPEAKGSVDTTFSFTLIKDEATITYTENPDYAVITGMPSPLSVTTEYTAGQADFTMAAAPSALGLIFEGWEDTEGGQIYPAGSTFSMLLPNPRRTATLRTKWSIDPSYNITIDFDSNGGTGTVPSQSKSVGQTVALPLEALTKIGYKLGGWTTTKNDSTTKWDFTTILTGDPKNIALHALWDEDPSSWGVTIVKAPELAFRTTEVNSSTITIPLEIDSVLKVQDTYPGKITDWTISVSSSQLKSPTNKLLGKNALQYFDSSGAGQSIYHDGVLGEGSPVAIWKENNSAVVFEYERIFDTSLKETFGVKLLPGEARPEIYEATVTWSISVGL